MEFNLNEFKTTELYKNLTQSQKDYVANVLDWVKSYEGTSKSGLEITTEFGDNFGTGKEWDVKNKKKDGTGIQEGAVSNEYLGNFMYGLAGSALGMEDRLLVSAAAGQQQLKNEKKDIKNGLKEGNNRKKLMFRTAVEYFNGWYKVAKNNNKYDLLYFGEGDNPGDSQKIIDGINMAKKCGVTQTPISAASLFAELMGEKVHADFISFFFNPFDENWKGRDPKWLEEFKKFWQGADSFKNAVDTLSYFLNPFDPNFSNVLQNAKNFYIQYIETHFAFSIVDPLALDLNGDGKIGISPASNGGAYFDHNGDGVSHKSSWISKEDGILAYDRNGNGKIDDGSELFGNFTQIKDKDGNQRLAKDGYEALKEFDSNNDGLIDSKDDKFKDLKIWQDANSNGISDEGELKSLDELGIASLSLNHNEVNEDLGGGNIP